MYNYVIFIYCTWLINIFSKIVKFTSTTLMFLEEINELSCFLGDFLLVCVLDKYFGPGNMHGIASSFSFGYFKSRKMSTNAHGLVIGIYRK